MSAKISTLFFIVTSLSVYAQQSSTTKTKSNFKELLRKIDPKPDTAKSQMKEYLGGMDVTWWNGGGQKD